MLREGFGLLNCLVIYTNFDFVSGVLSGDTKIGPAARPLLAINSEKAATGHEES